MLVNFLIFCLFFFTIIFIFSFYFQKYLDNVFFNNKVKYFSFIEKILYKTSAIDLSEKTNWKGYFFNILKLGLVSGVFTFLILIFQEKLPLNQNKSGNVSIIQALNITISFLTQTNWQSYNADKDLSYLSKSVALGIHYFFAPSTALSVAIALIRALSSDISKDFGNFWIDFTKSILYVFFPLSILISLILVGLGSIQNFLPNLSILTLEGLNHIIPMGPVASQTAIKMLGGNGGSFFSANGAHPFEMTGQVSLVLQSFTLILIPSSLILLLGNKVKVFKHGVSIWMSMFILMITLLTLSVILENNNNGLLSQLGHSFQINYEGKEVRLNLILTNFFNMMNTATSTGATAGAVDSAFPLVNFLHLFSIMLGSIIFGGTGAGLYGIFIYIVITVFISGLMVGRTPEYLGRRIEDTEIKWSILCLLFMVLGALVAPAIVLFTPESITHISRPNPHRLTQVLYAFASTTSNNGSTMGGFDSSSPWWCVVTSSTMLIGRFGTIFPALAIANSLGNKKRYASTPMSFPVEGIVFTGLLSFVILVIGGLTYLPALVLGPITEFAEMISGKLY